jgi:hypothetical protein
MTKIIYPCGCAEDPDRYGFSTRLDCPLHGLTPPEDEPEPEEQE